MKKILLTCLMLVFVLYAWAQDRTVSGKVTDADTGGALPGVNVLLKGTGTGVTTDLDGNFKISVPSDGGTLVFTFIGMAAQEVEIGSRSVINVEMETDIQQLSEVVVTALGFEADRDKLGASSSSIDGGAVAESGEKTLLDGLQGKASGVNITSTSGDPGAGGRIVIRGATSITGNLQPLIVIDGVPMYNSSSYGEGSSSVAGVAQQSRLNDINPNDIASVEVLKGASAAAVWGSRAANGVLVITTKKGTAGKKDWSVSVTSRYAVDQINKEVDLQYDYGQGFGGYYDPGFGVNGGNSLSWGDRISDRSGGTDNFITDPNAPGYLGYFESDNSDNLYYAIAPGEVGNVHGGKNDRSVYNPHDAIFQNGLTVFNSIGLQNADENGNVFMSFSNQNQRGIVKANSNYIRNTARLNATRFVTETVTATINANYSNITSDRIQMGSNTSGLLLGALRNPADFNMLDYTGTYYDVNGIPNPDRQRAYRNPLGRRVTSSYDNPLWTVDNNLSSTKVDRVIGKMELQYDPISWLNLTGRVGLDTYYDERNDFINEAAATSPGGFYAKELISETQINADFIARANANITEDITGNFLVGANWNDRKFSNVGSSITNFINTASPPDVGNSPASARGNIGEESHIRSIGYYSTASFGFYDQVFLNASGRLDYFSAFPVENNSFFYPSADVAWQFSKLMPASNLFSFGKLRASYGQVGRAPGAYSTQTFYIGAAYTDGWGQNLDAAQYGGGFRQSSQAGNPDILPEVKTEVEFGVDLRFLNDLMSLSATYYDNTTDNLIVAKELPNSTGFATTIANAAEINNKGIEVELDATVYKSDDLSVNIYGNWFRNRNEVVSIEGTDEISLAGFTGSTSSAVVGEQLGVIYGDRWDRDEAGNFILDENGFPQLAGTPGVLGDPNPDWRAAMGSQLSFKGFSLNVLFEHSQGGEIWNGTKGALAYFGRAGYTDHTVTLTAAQASTLLNYAGATAEDWYGPDFQNSDGSYTVRGYVQDFGDGDVLVDGSAYWSGPFSGFTGPAEQFMEDATFTRLRELTIGYDLSTFDFIDKVGLTGASVDLTGRNLLLWTDYTGVDPNTNLGGATNGLGLDYFNNPSTRSYVVTLNLKF
ncbi:SusC/RagA family TonB-linked outer membrane protein [Marivirga arenosa]|uniref:SusC/RagA family TonB-linked outer membrane protein n=1 Tax=Marivirga arenosa TaxID=3059076 RepID=A0AA51N7B8_9BACT|nr:SusC/RagA family TonB-linked outer membrane protein [Marivirga sp. ABR2-2]WMN07494.1 SusC/RagA family TonB-linked outer membrane protein [Marivirga sp. ABR2-2]